MVSEKRRKRRWRLQGDFTLRKEQGEWKLSSSGASTYYYILVKKENYDKALAVLSAAGYEVEEEVRLIDTTDGCFIEGKLHCPGQMNQRCCLYESSENVFL